MVLPDTLALFILGAVGAKFGTVRAFDAGDSELKISLKLFIIKL